MSAPRLLLCLAVIAPLAARADDTAAPPMVPESPAVADPAPMTPTAPAPDTEPQRVVVMSTGRVVQGTITETPGGYHISTPNGNFTVTYNDVVCTAASVRDAHQKLQKLFTPPSASGHVILCRWCIENRLYDLAMDEVQAALHLEPARAEARNLLWQLETLLNPQPEQSPDNVLTWDSMLAPPVNAPGGLTRDTTQEFVRRVQPLVLNTCANARCHGNSQSDFPLQFVRSSGVGGQSITTENIESVFKFVDIDNPRESRLFTALQDPEIPQHRTVFTGPRGRDHLETIAAWIMQGSLERGGKPPQLTVPEVKIASAVDVTTQPVVEQAVATEVVESTPSPHVPMTLDDAPAISIEPLPPVNVDPVRIDPAVFSAASPSPSVSIPTLTFPPVLQPPPASSGTTGASPPALPAQTPLR